MKRKLAALSRRYLAALQKYLRAGTGARPSSAHGLGKEAAALGFGIFDLVRMHEIALAAVGLTVRPSTVRLRLTRHAKVFFAEASRVVKKTPGPVLKSTVPLAGPRPTLAQHTAQLAATNRFLKQGLLRSKAAEAALRTSGRHNAKVLQKSRQLQSRLRALIHQLLTAQESERTKISHELQDEVAQTLLGINARLLTLKKAADGDPENLRKEIASTRRVVEDSIHSINRFARELNVHPPAFREPPVSQR
jgi:signal transduction histidine kinase